MNIHGEWEISLVGNVLVRSTAGHFNVQGAKSCFEESQIKAPKDKPWALLGNASNWEMAGEDSFQLFPSMFEWAFDNGCLFGAIIMSTNVQKKIYEHFSRNSTGDKFKYFKNLDAACAWLTEKGFSIHPDDYPHYAFIERTKIEVKV